MLPVHGPQFLNAINAPAFVQLFMGGFNPNFVSPYPDFDFKEIIRYAKEKSVQMIMHNETGVSALNYDRQMDTAFRL